MYSTNYLVPMECAHLSTFTHYMYVVTSPSPFWLHMHLYMLRFVFHGTHFHAWRTFRYESRSLEPMFIIIPRPALPNESSELDRQVDCYRFDALSHEMEQRHCRRSMVSWAK